MNTILINASPRKNGNTAQLLQEAKKGAESVGAQVEYINLYDLNFTGCRSCMACKRKGNEKAKCYWKDDLSPLISRILQADNLIIGSPIYFGEPTAVFRALLERLLFCILSYDTGGSAFSGKVNTGMIYTMNVPETYYQEKLRPALEVLENQLRLLGGRVWTYAACDTLQVSDYSKYDMSMFCEAGKRKHYKEQFPLDRKAAFEMGAEMNRT